MPTATATAASLAPGATTAPGAGVDAALIRRVVSDDFDRWIRHIKPAAGCSHPIQLRGQRFRIEQSTGRVLSEVDTSAMPDATLYVPCGNRRETVCRHCSEVYRADTYQLVKAGLVGGKGVPTTVSNHQTVFLTVTAPGFGEVHNHALDQHGKPKPCHPRRTPETCPHGVVMDCRLRHDADDPIVGQPLCGECYDSAGQAVWNAWVGALWQRTTITANRLLDELEAQHGCKLRLSYTKVAEFQKRGVVHFHALVRLDRLDPRDPDAVLEPPATIRPRHLEQLLLEATRRAHLTTPAHPDRPGGWDIAWGNQIDVRSVTLTVRDVMDNGEINPDAVNAFKVAGYLAKYATKATEAAGHVSARITESNVDLYATPATLAGRVIAACWKLGKRPDGANRDEWSKTYGRLRRWAHCLGYGGHFSTKSRRYSTTLGALRQTRRDWARLNDGLGPAIDDQEPDEDTVTVGALAFAGIGWHTTADALLANSAAARAREYRAIAREELSTLVAS